MKNTKNCSCSPTLAAGLTALTSVLLLPALSLAQGFGGGGPDVLPSQRPVNAASSSESSDVQSAQPGQAISADTMESQEESDQPLAAIQDAEASFNLAQKELDRASERYKSGALTSRDFEKAKAGVNSRQRALAQARRTFSQERLAHILGRPVDVEFQQASVQQLATTLSKAANVSIVVGKTVPANLRITVEAHGVPLSSVLEMAAGQSDLEIGILGGGLILRPNPTINVNGITQSYLSPIAPWSKE